MRQTVLFSAFDHCRSAVTIDLFCSEFGVWSRSRFLPSPVSSPSTSWSAWFFLAPWESHLQLAAPFPHPRSAAVHLHLVGACPFPELIYTCTQMDTNRQKIPVKQEKFLSLSLSLFFFYLILFGLTQLSAEPKLVELVMPVCLPSPGETPWPNHIARISFPAWHLTGEKKGKKPPCDFSLVCVLWRGHGVSSGNRFWRKKELSELWKCFLYLVKEKMVRITHQGTIFCDNRNPSWGDMRGKYLNSLTLIGSSVYS